MLKALVATGLISSVGIAAVVMMFFAWGSNRYELAVEFELDGQRYKGSTVWEISAFVAPVIPAGTASGLQVDVKGEAIDIPLADGRTIFVLRRGVNNVPTREYGRGFLLRCVPGESLADKVRNLSAFKGICDLRLHPWILIADQNGRLEDIDYDPAGKSPQRVLILSTVATTTNSPVTQGIASRHPWISSLPRMDAGGALTVHYFQDFTRR